MEPLIQEGEHGHGGANWQLVFADDFGVFDTAMWSVETMEDPLNRAGNEGMDREGDLHPGHSVSGKRWSAWYDEHADKTIVATPDGLELRAHVEEAPDPTRRGSYTHEDGQVIEPGAQRIYLPWIQTAQRVWDESQKQHVSDEAKALHEWRYGFFEIEVDVNAMDCEGVRLSCWLMPTRDTAGRDMSSAAYDADPANGIEVDLTEIETGGKMSGLVMAKVVGGAAGDTAGGAVETVDVGVSLLDGKSHVIGHWWDKDRHVWYLDGREINREEERVMQVFAQMIVSREANSGLVGPEDGRHEDSIEAAPPYLPRDPGLSLADCFRNLDKVRASVAVIKRVSVWQQEEQPDLPPLTPPTPIKRHRHRVLFQVWMLLVTGVTRLWRWWRGRQW